MNLQDAIDAVREESLDNKGGSLRTRGRLLAAVERSPRRRVHAVVAAVIASMFGASAFAWYARDPAPVPTQPAIVVSEPAVLPVETPRAIERTVARIDPVIEPEPVPAPAVSARDVREPAIERAAAVPEPTVTQPDPELALYAAAHDLHFKQQNMAAALDAWNRYIDAAPNGRLVPEARFNRLVALVKLERWDDAARELATFDDPLFRPRDIERLRALIASHRQRQNR